MVTSPFRVFLLLSLTLLLSRVDQVSRLSSEEEDGLSSDLRVTEPGSTIPSITSINDDL